MKQKYILIVASIVVIILIGIVVNMKYTKQDPFSSLRQRYPELSSFVDDIERSSAKLNEGGEKANAYLTLGLAWKSLADRTREPEHYREALRAYEQGISLTERKDTRFLLNAANMATYLGDYPTAEKYFEEAISVTPGDTDLYIRLAELYEYQMKKPSDVIIVLLDRGIARAFASEPLKQYKARYLVRMSEQQ